MNETTHLIIGAGPAALAAAQAIRARDKSGAITLLTREEVSPYSPAALPYLISGELSAPNLFAKGEAALRNLGVDIAKGREVSAILAGEHKVECADGTKIAYDKLLIATGARPQIPPGPFPVSDRIHVFRTYADFERLAGTLGQKAHVAIFGAGLVAVEAAEKLGLAGHRVTMIARSSLLRKYFRPENVAVVEQSFTKAGATIVKGATLTSARLDGDKVMLTLSDGQEIAADQLIVATGVVPNDVANPDLVRIDGSLEVGRGMETALPDVWAAGDVAAAPSFFDDRPAACPILPEAVAQGRIAGANMAGEKLAYSGWVACNTLRSFEHSLFSIGLAGTGDGETVTVGDARANISLTLKGEVLVGAEALNMNHVHPGVFLYLIREKVPVKRHWDLLLQKHRETAAWLMLAHRKASAL